MIVKIPISNKTYELIDTLTRKEYREYSNKMMPFIGFEERLISASKEEIEKMTADIQNRSADIDTIWFEWFNRCVKGGITKEYFENEMRSIEAIALFSAIWKASTDLPLEYAKQSTSRSTASSMPTPSS